MRRADLLLIFLCMAAPATAHAAGDPAQGERLYASRCTFCHTLDQDRIGPRHRGVYGRRVASVPGYRYSAALAAQTFTWDAARLDSWLADPGATVPGTRMFGRVKSAQDRADLIAYLRSVSGR